MLIKRLEEDFDDAFHACNQYAQGELKRLLGSDSKELAELCLRTAMCVPPNVQRKSNYVGSEKSTDYYLYILLTTDPKVNPTPPPFRRKERQPAPGPSSPSTFRFPKKR
jgi:hypothetical protein